MKCDLVTSYIPIFCPLCNLAVGLDDSEYPPQHKLFSMLQYVCRHHADNFDWFLRADDDVFIKVDVLKRLLSKLHSSEAVSGLLLNRSHFVTIQSIRKPFPRS